MLDWTRSQYLPYKDITLTNCFRLDKLVTTMNNAETRLIVEVDLIYCKTSKDNENFYNMSTKEQIFHYFSEYTSLLKPDIFMTHSKIVCDWTDKKVQLL